MMDYMPALEARRALRDRRRSRRFDLCVPVRWRSGTQTGRVTALGDLARGGVFLRTTDALARGDSVSGAFMLPRGGAHVLVVFRGEVAWCAPAGSPSVLGPGVGVRFTRVSTTSAAPHSIGAHLVSLDADAGPWRRDPPRKEVAVERLLAACRTPQARVRFFGSRVFS